MILSDENKTVYLKNTSKRVAYQWVWMNSAVGMPEYSLRRVH